MSMAQKTIAVLSGTSWSFYTDFSTALNQCASGSTIYLPGGNFVLSQSSDTINKSIAIIGVGHYPDSTNATGKSVLQGNLFFSSGGQNIYLEGVDITGDLQPIGTSVVINNVRFQRSRIRGSIYLTNGNAYFSEISFNECVVDYRVYSGSNVRFEKCILLNYFSNCLNCYFENNVFLYNGGSFNNVLNGFSFCELNNNIFANTSPIFYSSDNNVCRNNSMALTGMGGSNTTEINSITNITLNNTFVNVPSNGFNYNYDYHLLSTSTGKNAGTDGTDIGIYGTTYPYKPSAVPANPHISTKVISPSSAPNGTLPVNIRVIAQDK